MPKAPEQQARAQIDVQLGECGWIVQDLRDADFSASRGIALREIRLKTGPCDYLLLVDRKPVGVIEAKKAGTTLSIVADQSSSYAENLPEYLAAGLRGPPPFRYESTGVETFFRDERDPYPRSRRVFTFHRPETLAEWAAEPDTLRSRLARMPEATPLVTTGMRQCQIEAIRGLERSFAWDQPRALILDRQPAVPPKTLLQRVIFPGGRDEDTLTTLASRLTRLDRELDAGQREQPDDFEYAPFTHHGGLGKAHQLFGAELPHLLDEMNEALAA